VYDLSGRVAVITGGGRGIGAAIARALAKAGARVMLSGRDEQALAGVGAELGAPWVRCDVTRPDDVTALADATHHQLGPATIVVSNAGIAPSRKFADTDEAIWRETIEINLGGAYRLARAFLGDVVAAGAKGRILFIASVAAKIGFSYTSAYCASKHGVLGLSRSLAHELAPRGPTVNCVCPGWTDTDMVGRAVQNISRTTGRTPEKARRELERMSPQGRLVAPEEVAAVTLFLVSDAGAGITGQAWNVDGGQVMA